jgi:hypothetical protein
MGYGRTEDLNEPVFCDGVPMDTPVVGGLGEFHHGVHQSEWLNARRVRQRLIDDCRIRGGVVGGPAWFA